MTFGRDEFVADCLVAVAESDVVGAVAEVVRRHVLTGAAIDDAFRGAGPGSVTLYASSTLTVQRIEWSPGVQSAAHDHRMWAVVGVYGGAEHNSFYRRSANGLEDVGGRVVAAGEALVLGVDAIHSVANPSHSPVGGLHVYGGDIDGVPRSQWRPDGSEGPLAEVRPGYLAMWAALREYAKDEQRRMSGVELYEAISEINRCVADKRRVLSRDEVRSTLATMWAR